jgi:hypothetical protein
LFTNGDNDTFPVWWLQDVAGVRRDVRIVNLSLGNTLWYIDQLKNREPWGAKKIPLSFSDASIQKEDENQEGALSYDFGEPRFIEIPVKKEILSQFTNDTTIINQGKMRFRWEGRPYREVDGKQIHLFRVQDKLVLDILQQVKFERPVYYSATVGPDAFCGLENFFRYEGMAMRICPVPQRRGNSESINLEVMEQCLMNVDNSDNYSKEPKYGFKFRNLNNMSVYYDEVHRRLMQSYRSLYMSYAANLTMLKQNQKAIAALDKMNELISIEQFPLTFDLYFRISKIYDEAGAKDKSKYFAELGAKLCEEIIKRPNVAYDYKQFEIMGRQIGPYNVGSMLYEVIEDYDNASRILNLLLEEVQKYRGTDKDDRLASNYYSILRDLKRYEILGYNKKNGLQATEKYVEEKKNELIKQPSQENMFYIRTYEETLQEIKNKNNTSKSDTINIG